MWIVHAKCHTTVWFVYAALCNKIVSDWPNVEYGVHRIYKQTQTYTWTKKKNKNNKKNMFYCSFCAEILASWVFVHMTHIFSWTRRNDAAEWNFCWNLEIRTFIDIIDATNGNASIFEDSFSQCRFCFFWINVNIFFF